MAQFARPDADTYNLDLYTDQGGGAVLLFQAIDETVPNDADYIQSPLLPTSDVYVCHLSMVEDPLSSTGHIFRNRYSKSAAGGAQIDMTFQLRESYVSEAVLGTLIVSRAFADVSATPTTDAYVLLAGEADAITNYALLFDRIITNQP